MALLEWKVEVGGGGDRCLVFEKSEVGKQWWDSLNHPHSLFQSRRLVNQIKPFITYQQNQWLVAGWSLAGGERTFQLNKKMKNKTNKTSSDINSRK